MEQEHTMADEKGTDRGKAGQAAGTFQDTLGATLGAANEWRDKLVAFTRQRPLTALLSAVSVGYVLHRGRRRR